jgi:hypothetical protein
MRGSARPLVSVVWTFIDPVKIDASSLNANVSPSEKL